MKYLSFVFFAIILVFNSCNNNKFDVDVSKIKVDLKFHRLDKEMFTLDTNKMESETKRLITDYPKFMELYSTKIVYLGGVHNQQFTENFRKYITFPTSQEVYKQSNKQFADIQGIENQLTEAFKHYKYYFPKKIIPEIYFCNTSFNYAVFTDDNLIGIGLEMYLGKNCVFYERVGKDNYLRAKMIPERILPDCMKAWAMAEFPNKDSIDNLMSNMIYEAKLSYLVDAMLPTVPDTIKWGFTGKQLEWCEKFEKDMWTYLVENKLLFETKQLEIRKFTEDAPFTAAFVSTNPKAIKPPARAVVWLARQIVDNYMERNEKITIFDLMAENDALKIVNGAKYKP